MIANLDRTIERLTHDINSDLLTVCACIPAAPLMSSQLPAVECTSHQAFAEATVSLLMPPWWALKGQDS